MESITSKGYGLRHKVTGKLAQLIEEYNDGDGYSNEYKYELREGDDKSRSLEFEVESPEEAALVLVINRPWYNSTKIRPSWGDLDMTDYEVVEVVRVSSVDIKPCEVPRPITFGRAVDERKTMRKLAERYLEYSIPDEFSEKPLSFVVVPAPEGESLESLKSKCTNRPILLSTSGDYPELCLGVFDLPEEYSDLFKDGLGVGLILTHFQF